MWRGRALTPRALYAVGGSSLLIAIGGILIRGTHVDAAPSAAGPPATAAAVPRQAREAQSAQLRVGRKAPTVIPARPFDLAGANLRANLNELAKPNQGLSGPGRASAAAGSAGDTSAPTGPTFITAGSQSIFTLTASWSGAADPESGIAEYVFGVGTVPNGDYNSLAGRALVASHDEHIGEPADEPRSEPDVLRLGLRDQRCRPQRPDHHEQPGAPGLFQPLGQSGNTMRLAARDRAGSTRPGNRRPAGRPRRPPR